MFFNLSFDADGPGAMLIRPKCPALKMLPEDKLWDIFQTMVGEM